MSRRAAFRHADSDDEHEARRNRARDPRIYLLNARLDANAADLVYSVMGTTGTQYEVRFPAEIASEDDWQCTCPDYQRRERICKHGIFVRERVLASLREQLPRRDAENDRRLWVLARDHPPHAASLAGFVSQRVVASPKPPEAAAPATVAHEVAQRPFLGESCPICFEKMEESTPVVYCRLSCGQSLHRGCYMHWSRAQRNAKTTCVYCRSEFAVVKSSS